MSSLAQKDEYWAQLMRKSQQGDAEAYSELLHDLSSYTKAFVSKRLVDSSRVEDVVQEVLISIHRAKQTYDPDKAFAPWFFTIVRRRFIDQLRKLSRQTAREYLDEELDSKQFAGNNMESKESELCLIFDLQTMLKRIPKKQREAFTLMKVQGLSVREAADLSGMSESAVKVSVHRARKSLQKLLER